MFRLGVPGLHGRDGRARGVLASGAGIETDLASMGSPVNVTWDGLPQRRWMWYSRESA